MMNPRFALCLCLSAALAVAPLPLTTPPATAQSASAQSAAAQPLDSAESHAARGRAAAAEQWRGYASLCNLDSRMRNVNLPRKRKPGATTNKRKRPKAGQTEKRLRRDLPPTRVFDNLYVFGTGSVVAWLYGTPEGYILIDGLNTDEEAEKYIFGGMKTLGLDPSAIRHVLVTHGHGDHYGGADYVAAKLGLKVSMSAPDWALVATLGTHPRFGPPPSDGLTVTDGQVLKAGTSELTIHLSPGHTPGTISPIFPVSDGGARHMAMIWGGTGFNFGPDVATFLTYADTARKMRQTATRAGVDVYLSGHPRRDGTASRLAALETRTANAPHPFVRDEKARALFTVLEHCALAQAARFSKPAD